MKQNFYQLEGSKLKEFISILHLPYTLMCLSFITIGFSISRINDFSVYLVTLIAYFFGLGIASHSFDQLKGMGSSYVKYLTENDLIIIGCSSLTASIIIGIGVMIRIDAWYLLILIPLQVFFVFAYPMKKLFKGFFHDDFWFSVSFGFLPVIIGYYINTSSFSILVMWWGIVALIISGIEINLSRYVRHMRKEKVKQLYIEKPERALKLLCLMTYLIAAILIFT